MAKSQPLPHTKDYPETQTHLGGEVGGELSATRSWSLSAPPPPGGRRGADSSCPGETATPVPVPREPRLALQHKEGASTPRRPNSGLSTKGLCPHAPASLSGGARAARRTHSTFVGNSPATHLTHTPSCVDTSKEERNADMYREPRCGGGGWGGQVMQKVPGPVSGQVGTWTHFQESEGCVACGERRGL